MNNSRLIERAFKLRFGLKLCLFVLAGMLSIAAFIYITTSKGLGESYGKAIYTIYNLKINIFPLFFASFYSIFILALVTVSIAVIAVLFSHKIAGPIYRVEKNLDLISSGDLTVGTRFRGDDQLRALGDEMNSMVRSLNHAARGCGDAIEDIKSAEERIGRLLKEERPSEKEFKEAVEALKKGVEGLNRAVSNIKTKE